MTADDSTASMRPTVLMIGPLPPAVGGMATVIEQLLGGPLARTCRLLGFPANPSSARRRFLPASIGRHAARLVALARRLRRERIDVLHVHTCSGFTFYRNLADVALARLHGVPVVLHIHGARFDEFCGRAGAAGRWVIRRALSRVDRVVVLSRWWRETLREYAPAARFAVVPNGVAVPPSARQDSTGGPERPCRFLFLAAVCRRKGIDTLLGACAALRARGTRFRVVVAGPEETAGDARRLAEQIHRQGLGDAVEYVGTVTGAAKEELLGGSDCLVLPSRAEGLPLTLLEAGARGCPVVASAVGAVPEVIDDERCGLIVPPGEAGALAGAMETLATDPQQRRDLGTALRARIADRYSLERQSVLLAGIYRELCSAAEHTALTGLPVGGGTRT